MALPFSVFRILSVVSLLLFLSAGPTAAIPLLVQFDYQGLSEVAVGEPSAPIFEDDEGQNLGPDTVNLSIVEDNTDWRALTASRARSEEITANALFENKTWNPIDLPWPLQGPKSRTFLQGTVTVLTPSRSEVFVDFFLPPGFVEVIDNLELGPMLNDPNDVLYPVSALSARISAALGACEVDTDGNCAVIRSDFALEATLASGWALPDFAPQLELDVHTSTRNAALDISVLQDMTVEIGGTRFEPSATWDFDGFTGRISLGEHDPGTKVVFGYQLTAEVTGPTAFSSAAAAINDPLTVSAPIIGVEAVPIPEPSTLSLLAIGALLLGWRRGNT